MCLDHLRFIPSPAASTLFYLGRPAFPIFALLCGWNLILYSRRPAMFTLRVSILAGVMLCLQLLIFQSLWPVNPISCLALGLLIAWPTGKLIAAANTVTANLAAILILGLTLSLSQYFPLQSFIAEGWAGVLLVVLGALCAGQAPKSPSLAQILPIVLVCAMVAGQINVANTFANIIATSSTMLALLLLLKNPLPPCPAPNTLWLYLAFPLSLLPAAAWHYWMR